MVSGDRLGPSQVSRKIHGRGRGVVGITLGKQVACLEDRAGVVLRQAPAQDDVGGLRWNASAKYFLL